MLILSKDASHLRVRSSDSLAPSLMVRCARSEAQQASNHGCAPDPSRLGHILSQSKDASHLRVRCGAPSIR
jgi:hypothetical protein